MRTIAIKHWNADGLKEPGITILNWMKDFDLYISTDGKHYIDPRERCLIRENHLRSLLRKDVSAPSSKIDGMLTGLKFATNLMAKEGKWKHLIEDLEIEERYL